VYPEWLKDQNVSISMIEKLDELLKTRLELRASSGNLRALFQFGDEEIDFCSNDYFGLARNEDLSQAINKRQSLLRGLHGSTGSRLISGNTTETEKLERQLAQFFQTESTLVFNSGYNASQSVVAALAQKGDVIFYDQLSHVCLKEGAWLSKAQSFSFKHNDLEDLYQKIRRVNTGSGSIFLITESIFSMDGDEAPLEQLALLAQEYGAILMVDEAHSTGIYGEKGAGLVQERGLEHLVPVRIFTFGKAMGVHGACVAGSKTLRDYLINHARGFIYTTALPQHSIMAISAAFYYLQEHHEALQAQLFSRIKHFQNLLLEKTHWQPPSNSAIQPLLIPGNEKCKAMAERLRQEGFQVKAILSPTVPVGKERIRISLHVHNTSVEIDRLVESLTQLI
jgi:8-amino-7-oxononanoate synthase